jgi:hypothetical protein
MDLDEHKKRRILLNYYSLSLKLFLLYYRYSLYTAIDALLMFIAFINSTNRAHTHLSLSPTKNFFNWYFLQLYIEERIKIHWIEPNNYRIEAIFSGKKIRKLKEIVEWPRVTWRSRPMSGVRASCLHCLFYLFAFIFYPSYTSLMLNF